MKRTFVFAAIALFAAAASAQQYKWTDKDGKVRYGDVPPAGANAAALKPPPRVSSAPAASAKPDAPKSDADRQRTRQAQAGQEAQEAEAKKENCARSQDALRTLESGQRIARMDAKGERYFLDDAQLAHETAKARQAVREWCS